MSIKEQKKNQERQSRNRKYKTLIKDQFKKIDDYLTGKLKEKKVSKEELEKTVSETQKILDKASRKKIIHKNKGRHKKRQLYNNLNTLKEKGVVER